MTTPTLAVLGCGTMGRAIVTGLLDASVFPAHRVIGTVRRAAMAEQIRAELGIDVLTDNIEACARADAALLAVKPQVVGRVLADDALRLALRGKLLISICAGVRIEQLERHLPQTRIVRAMPNTPCTIREGMTVLSPGATATADDLALGEAIFGSVGRCRVRRCG